MDSIIFKIVTREEWSEAETAGVFAGAPIDIADGFIHFSTSAQVRETAAKHFGGRDNLLLVHVDASQLGDALRYEASRGGQLFPHLYAPMPLKSAIRVEPLPLDGEGNHVFPAEIGA
ncbi:MAG: DUF952 domain-containing protein [Nitratireductor sp.]